jgi:hypothetical protein
LQSVVGEIKIIRPRLAGHIARMGEMRNEFKYFYGKNQEKRLSGWDRVKCLKLILKEYDV